MSLLGYIIDLLRDANLTNSNTQCTSPTLNSPHSRPSKEERDLLDDFSHPETERKKRKKVEEGKKGNERKDRIRAKQKDEIELEKAQSVLTSGGTVHCHDLLRDANLTTTQCTSPTLNSPHSHPSKEGRDLPDDPSRPEGERKKQKKAEEGRKGKKEKTGS